MYERMMQAMAIMTVVLATMALVCAKDEVSPSKATNFVIMLADDMGKREQGAFHCK